MSGRGFPKIPCLVAALGGVALWLSFPGASQGAELRISCPLAIEVKGLRARQAPTGWQLLVDQNANLTAAVRLSAGGLLHGPPEESGYLVPTEAKERRHGERVTWWQRWQLERPHWYQTFAHCDYGAGRGVPQLVRPVPEDAAECILTSSRRGSVVDQVMFVCK